MMTGRFDRRGYTHIWVRVHLDDTTSVTHEHTSSRSAAGSSWSQQYTCVSWQDSHGTHALPAERGLTSCLFTTRKSQDIKLVNQSKVIRSKRTGSQWYMNVANFSRIGVQNPIPWQVKLRTVLVLFTDRFRLRVIVTTAVSKFGMSSSVELSSVSLSDSTTMIWCHEYQCGDCWWSACNAPDP